MIWNVWIFGSNWNGLHKLVIQKLAIINNSEYFKNLHQFLIKLPRISEFAPLFTTLFSSQRLVIVSVSFQIKSFHFSRPIWPALWFNSIFISHPADEFDFGFYKISTFLIFFFELPTHQQIRSKMTEMDCQPPKSDSFANIMLLTANVGSIFEDVSIL